MRWDNYENPYMVSVDWMDGRKTIIHDAGFVNVRGDVLEVYEYVRPNLNRTHLGSMPLFNVRTFHVKKIKNIPSLEEDPSRDVAS